MTSGKRPSQALILSANTLLDGEVVYHNGEGWTPLLADARVAVAEADLRDLESALADSEARGDVVEPALLPVSTDAAGRVIPTHYRERIRVLGPTIRTDLGPQAQGELSHVSV